MRYERLRRSGASRLHAPGQYDQYAYVGITPKRDRVAMRDRDAVEATLPLGAPSFGGELETSGALVLGMTAIRKLESSHGIVRVDLLAGECAEPRRQ